MSSPRAGRSNEGRKVVASKIQEEGGGTDDASPCSSQLYYLYQRVLFTCTHPLEVRWSWDRRTSPSYPGPGRPFSFRSPQTTLTPTQRRLHRRHPHPFCRAAEGKAQKTIKDAGRAQVINPRTPPSLVVAPSILLTGTGRAPGSNCRKQHGHRCLADIPTREHLTSPMVRQHRRGCRDCQVIPAHLFCSRLPI